MAGPVENREDLERRLGRRPVEDSAALAARAAARVLPLIVRALAAGDAADTRRFAELTLASARAILTSLARGAAGKDTPRANALRAAARAAAADADAAARAAARAAAAAIWKNIDADLAVLEKHGARALLKMPLWSGDIPAQIADDWLQLKAALRPEDRWEPWFDWYEAQLAGRPVWPQLDAAANDELEARICLIDESLWQLGPAVVNAEIERLIAEAMPAAKIAAQGPGPYFGLDSREVIAPAPHWEYDASGDIPKRIRSLLPLARRAAGDLVRALPENDPHTLRRDASDCLDALTPEAAHVDWARLFGLAMFVENAAAAAERAIADRTVPELEDPAKKALDTLRVLLVTLLAASGEGRALLNESDAFALSPAEQRALGEAGGKLARAAAAAPKVAAAAAAEELRRAAEAIGQGPFAERGSVYGLAAIGNFAVLLVPLAILAGLPVLGYVESGPGGAAVGAGAAYLGNKGVEQSAMFKSAAKTLGGKFDALATALGDSVGATTAQVRELWRDQVIRLAPFRAFVRDNERDLRSIAQRSARMRWALRYIDFIVKSESERGV